MEIKYTRDLDHNYLVIETEQEENYQWKMIEQNAPEGLLKHSIRRIDGKKFLYYEIDARQNLSNYFAVKKLDREDMQRLVRALCEVGERLADYLLGSEGLVLNADTVFIEPNARRFCFIYVPEKTGDRSLGRFFEEMLEGIATEDETFVQAMYQLCEDAQNENFTLKELKETSLWSGKLEEEKDVDNWRADVGREKSECQNQWTAFEEEKSNDRIGEEGGGMEEAAFLTQGSRESPSEKSKLRETKFSGAVRPYYISVLFILVMLAGLYVRMEYVLTPLENGVSLAITSLCVFFAIINLIISYKMDVGETKAHRKKRRSRKSKQAEEEDQMAESWQMIEAEEDIFRDEEGERNRKQFKQEAALYTENKPRCFRKLYGRDNPENIHISLERLPMTIGRMPGRVDFLLRDESVSGIHARIFENERKSVTICDLNSTNGTWCNGLRLMPNESREIRRGDEICLGNLVFDYR